MQTNFDPLSALIQKQEKFQVLLDGLRTARHIHLRGCAGSFPALLASLIFRELQRPLLFIANSQMEAEQIREDLQLISPLSKPTLLSAAADEPYPAHAASPDVISQRLEAVQAIYSNRPWLMVSTPEALFEPLPDKTDFLCTLLVFVTGQSVRYDDLLRSLSEAGFERTDLVEQVGEFSVRGDIIDFYPWNSTDPVRLELFGERIESLRTFDVISQRSLKQLERVEILPNLSGETDGQWLSSVLPENAVLFFTDRSVVRSRYEDFLNFAALRYESLAEGKPDLPKPDQLFIPADDLKRLLQFTPALSSDLIADTTDLILDFGARPHPEFGGSIKRFIEYLSKQDPKIQIQIQSAHRDQSNRLQNIIEEEELAVSTEFTVGSLHGGFEIPTLGLVVLTDHEIFERFKRRKVQSRFRSGSYLRQLGNLSLFDHVVHIDYGIGQYLGMTTLEYGQVKKECIKIGYRDGDHLFVTVDRLNRVQKFSSEQSGPAQLTKLRSGEWERTTTKTRESVRKIAAELIQIYAARKAQTGYGFSPDSHLQKELEAAFPYEETPDQHRSIHEVKRDMEKDEPMDRLLCGDVGFGKTEVAIRAAFKAVNDGKQVALLAPTTILAFQHNETFRERMSELPLRIEMLNRFKTPREQKQIVEDLAAGKVDIIIATHRLLSKDIQFKNLGLLVIDEEQRFGVQQKETLKKLRLSVDVLSMTATPIPRTLHMALMGARDLSHIETPPRNRRPVHTEIVHWDDEKLAQVIRRELDRGGQVYFVHNRVETITAVREALLNIVPAAKIVIGHGQLPERQLEDVILNFMHGKYDILLASMIIENGLDIPNVNTIIINRADKFGLSQLYQLRGRVGRSDQQAFAYLVVPPLEKLTEISRQRLRAIQDFSELGSGFKIALRDLEIRGAGDLLGKDQSGFVQSVGFEMYTRILEEAVLDMKQGVQLEAVEAGPAKARRTDPKVDVDFDLLIPPEYIRSELERISIYHRLVNFHSDEQVNGLVDELKDRFGKVPEVVLLFLLAMQIKIIASRILAGRIILKEGWLKIIFDPLARQDERFFSSLMPAIMNNQDAAMRFLNQDELGFQFRLNGENRLEQLEFAKKVLHPIAGLT